MSGCAQVMVPVGESSSTTKSTTVPDHGKREEPSAPVDVSPKQSAGDIIVPNRPVQHESRGAVAKLLEDAWRYNRAGEYDRSNAVAERAMRINHTEPEIYLVMASNYFATAQLHLAEQLAFQGLPLASGNFSVKANLQQLLVDIRTKMP